LKKLQQHAVRISSGTHDILGQNEFAELDAEERLFGINGCSSKSGGLRMRDQGCRQARDVI
jgi:hypothetical protein